MFLDPPKTRDGTAEDSIPSVPNPEGGCRNTMIVCTILDNFMIHILLNVIFLYYDTPNVKKSLKESTSISKGASNL